MISGAQPSDHLVLGQLSYLSPFPPVAQFGGAASSRKSPGSSKLLPFKSYAVKVKTHLRVDQEKQEATELNFKKRV